MTRTENDLRTLLREPVDATTCARLLERTVAPGARPSRPSVRPTWRVGLAAAVAVVLAAGVVAGVVAVRPTNRVAPTPAGTSAAPTTVTTAPTPTAPPAIPLDTALVTFATGSGYRAGATMLFAGEQTVDALPGGGGVAVATVHVVEGDGPARVGVPGRAPVELGSGAVATWVTSEAGAGGVTSVPDALTWTLEGRSVTVEPSFDGATDAIVQAVAEAVTLAPAPVAVPVSVSSWPAGWVLDGLVSTYVHRDGATGAAGRDVLVDIGVDGDTTGTAVTIDSGGLAFAGSDDATGDPVVIAGRTWRWNAASRTFTWTGPDRIVRVTSQNAGIGRDALQTLLESTTLASSFGDESTWFDATGAFPS